VHDSVTLRFAFPDDATSLQRLAAVDSAELPAGPMLLAEVAGELRAGVSLLDGTAIADPFYRTAGLVALLRERAAQLTAESRIARPRRVGDLVRGLRTE
jgi:hypothetical protein